MRVHAPEKRSKEHFLRPDSPSRLRWSNPFLPPPPKRPQEPSEPLPYRSEAVSFEGAGENRLAGTLTRPEGSGPFPGVVLVAGAGPHDRDGSFMNHRPLLVLADYLTRAGFSVLRFDERGVGGSAGEFASASGEALAGDIAAAVETLRRQEDSDPARIGLIAHSEGGARRSTRHRNA